MNRLITTLFCLTLISLPAHAQQRDLNPSLHYTTLAKPHELETQEAQPAQDADIDTPQPQEELDPATRVWNKYKDLATGKAAEEEQAKKEDAKNKKKTAAIDKPAKPEKPEVSAPTETGETPEEAEQQKTGMSAILDEWRNAKDTQREMRTRSFKTPDLPGEGG